MEIVWVVGIVIVDGIIIECIQKHVKAPTPDLAKPVV
jgi:hypothetical protein